MMDFAKLRFVMLVLLSLSSFSNSKAMIYYVSLDGNDNHAGTEEFPFRNIEKGIAAATAGDTIFVKGGTYNLTSTIRIDKDGTEGAYIKLLVFPGEKVVLDFSGQALSGSNRGILLNASYWQIDGFDITGAGDNGLKIESGNYNKIQNCSFYRNRDSGLQMGGGASYNQVINCDSYYNADPPDYADADGFAAKLDVGVQNYFSGCRAWLNCDDGWDGYLRDTDHASTILENCWAFENGYLEDGTDPGSQANGNGFKMGGSDDKTLSHDYILRNCLAFKNKAKGFDQNSNMGSMILFNCTAHGNLAANYKIYKSLAPGKELVIKNCSVLGEPGDIADFAQEETNSWMEPFTVTPEDFISITDDEAYGPRQEDGNLPDIDYLYLVEGSDLIDAGVEVGIPFNGNAPDIGYIESGYYDPDGTEIPVHAASKCICYPNPARENVSFTLFTEKSGEILIQIYDLTGRLLIQTIPARMEGNVMVQDVDLNQVDPGICVYTINLGNSTIHTGKLMVR